MSLTLAAGLVGAGALGATAGSLAGGNEQVQKSRTTNIDKDVQTTQTRTYNRTYDVQRTYSPQSSRTVNYNPQVVMKSPNASIGSKQKLSSKKSTAPTQRARDQLPVDVSPETGDSGQRGSDQAAQSASGKQTLTTMALLGGAAYVLTQ